MKRVIIPFLSGVLLSAVIIFSQRQFSKPKGIQVHYDSEQTHDDPGIRIISETGQGIFVRYINGRFDYVSFRTHDTEASFSGNGENGNWKILDMTFRHNGETNYFLYSNVSGYPFSAYGDQQARVRINDIYYDSTPIDGHPTIILDGEIKRIRLNKIKNGFEIIGD